jgi:hypothetical protein
VPFAAVGFADFLTVLRDADGREVAAFLAVCLEAFFGGDVFAPLEGDFDADFFGDFRAIRLPFVAFRRSKE